MKEVVRDMSREEKGQQTKPARQGPRRSLSDRFEAKEQIKRGGIET